MINLAAFEPNLPIIKYLVEKGADFDIVSSTGFTPLASASANGTVEVVKYLLQVGASPDKAILKTA